MLVATRAPASQFDSVPARVAQGRRAYSRKSERLQLAVCFCCQSGKTRARLELLRANQFMAQPAKAKPAVALH